MTTRITHANIVNEGKVIEGEIIIKDQFIEKIGRDLSGYPTHQVIDAQGCFLLPGLIDDQVHFREPGLSHKGTISSESRAAVAGGITSYMDMPNTFPPTLTQSLLNEKFKIASQFSLANYSFYMGASNDNPDEVLKTDITKTCGLKIFMGSSSGNLLVNNDMVLNKLFANFPSLIATHCEDESIVQSRTKKYRAQYGDHMAIRHHANIRNVESCYRSSSKAVALAQKYGSQLHVLHISTAQELDLFENSKSIVNKKITNEVCLHHLWFTEDDYDRLGTRIKWNPSIKNKKNREALRKGVMEDRVDVLATDHAPHTLLEKNANYFNAPSGGPLVQHHLVALLELHLNGIFTLEKIVEKACHNPALLFRIDRRGFIREGYFADLTLVDLNRPWTVKKDNILSYCGWSPFEGASFRSSVRKTWVSGQLAYSDGFFYEARGHRLSFLRS